MNPRRKLVKASTILKNSWRYYMDLIAINDPARSVVTLKQSSERLQALCANPRLSEQEVLEIENISKNIVRASSAILIWAESIRPNGE